VIRLDSAWRAGRGQLDMLAKERNTVQKAVAVARKAGASDPANEARIKAIGEEIKAKTVRRDVSVLTMAVCVGTCRCECSLRRAFSGRQLAGTSTFD
jgi:seryl-tRNA synthetase